MRRIGLIGGMSWESTAVYYRRVNEQVRDALGGLHSADVAMRSVNFHDVVLLQKAGEWGRAAAMLSGVAKDLETMGAEMVLICTNTMHLMADEVQSSIGIPLLHIADITGKAVAEAGCRRPLLLATQYTMEQNFYKDRLSSSYGLEPIVPDEQDRKTVHDIIFGELCRGVVTAASKQRYVDIVAKGVAAGADGVILGCTEIGLLVGPQDFDIPTFDSTLLHADAAVRISLDIDAQANGRAEIPLRVH